MSDYKTGPLDTIAQRAKAAREHAGFANQTLAEKASGVPQAHISKIETGRTQNSYFILALARAYHCDVHWIDIGIGPAPWEEGHNAPRTAGRPSIEEAFDAFAEALGKVRKDRRARVLDSTAAFADDPGNGEVERDYVIRTLSGELEPPEKKRANG